MQSYNLRCLDIENNELGKGNASALGVLVCYFVISELLVDYYLLQKSQNKT